jgi:hypothetical protein
MNVNIEFDKPTDPFDYLFFLFDDRALLMIGYLFMYYYYCYFFFFYLFVIFVGFIIFMLLILIYILKHLEC